MKFFFLYILFSLLLIVSFGNSSFANENCEVLEGVKKYNCQVKNHCKPYKPDHITYKVEDYETKETDQNPFLAGKEIYRKNQNGIYACAIIKIQQSSFRLVKEKLLKVDQTGTLSSELQRKIELKINKLRPLAKAKKCNITDKRGIYSKKEILIESTYELCRYTFYLEHLKEFYKDFDNLLNTGENNNTETDSYDINYIVDTQEKIHEDIISEREHTYKIFHLAFQSYVDYESNLPVHILLELIKEDFVVYRQKLYQALSPLNQVVYKISNAMSIND